MEPPSDHYHTKQSFSLGRSFKLDRFLRSSRCKEETTALVAPVPHLLDSNFPPTDDERQKILGAIASARERLILHQSSDVRSRNSLSNGNPIHIQTTTHPFENFIKAQESLLSAFRLLPGEILELIFILCIPEFGPYRWCFESWRSHQSLHISQTCRRWRNLALNIPRLWACLATTDLTNNYVPHKVNKYSDYEFIGEILQRSRGEDLRLYITAPPEYRIPLGHPVVDLLIQNAHRWAAVFIRGSTETARIVFDTRHQYPKLKELEFRFSGEPSYGLSAPIIAPLLRDFSTCGIQYSHLYLPYHQLRAYRECSFGTEGRPGSLANILTQSPDIEKLELFGYGYSVQGVLIIDIRLQNLTALHLTPDNHHGGWEHVYRLLDKLILPSLESLKVGSCTESVLASISSLIYRSSYYYSPLRSLSIIYSKIYPGTLSALLRLTSRLEELDVDFPPLVDLLDLIASTASGSASPRLIPHIKRVVLRTQTKDVYGNESTVIALTRAIFNRGVSQNRNFEVDRYFTGGRRLMKTSFRLVFPDVQAAHAAQLALYTWTQSQLPSFHNNDESIKKIVDNLESLFAKLIKELPELRGGVVSRKRRFNLGFSSRLNRIMSELEQKELTMRRGLLALMVRFSTYIIVSSNQEISNE